MQFHTWGNKSIRSTSAYCNCKKRKFLLRRNESDHPARKTYLADILRFCNAILLWYDIAITRNENRDFIFLHFVVSAANCIREQRSFSALEVSSAPCFTALSFPTRAFHGLCYDKLRIFLIYFPKAYYWFCLIWRLLKMHLILYNIY